MVQKAKLYAGSEKYLIDIIPALKDIKSFYIVNDFTFNPGLLSKINRIVQAGKYDIVHSHLPHADFWCGFVKLLFPSKYKLVSTKHGYEESYVSNYGFAKHVIRPTPFYLVSWFAEKLIDRSFAVSHAIADLFAGISITGKQKMAVIHHGLKLDRSKSKEQPKEQIELPKRTKYQLIIVGRLVELKGHKYLLEALPAISSAMDGDVSVWIVGSGDYEKQLRAICSEKGIENQVQFLGFRRDVMQLLDASDISIIPSASEAFGLVFLESFEAGIPVVAFDVPAANEILIHQESGILVPFPDSKILAKEIIDLLQNANKREQIIQSGKNLLQQKYSFEKMVEKTVAFYNEVLV